MESISYLVANQFLISVLSIDYDGACVSALFERSADGPRFLELFSGLDSGPGTFLIVDNAKSQKSSIEQSIMCLHLQWAAYLPKGIAYQKP